MSTEPENPVVFARCTRGSDRQTAGTSCTGSRAEKLSPDGHPAPMFKCVTCGHTWVIPLGGGFSP